MHFGRTLGAGLILSGLALAAGPALATPSLVIDVDTGQTLIEHEATANWYPASLTKLMTVFVALQAVREGRISLDTPFVISPRAASMAPSKMGFRPGVEVTLDNALKMMMVKSPNDIAVMIAEGVSGSVEAFADEMNAAAARLGLKESHFMNPNGLPNDRQVSSARDMAMIGRALLREFPEESYIFGIGALQLGRELIRTHNGLIGRYPGADGMKTGFTCAAGFNVVASATHNGRRLIVVVLGSPTPRERTAKAISLFERGFAIGGGDLGAIESLPSPGVAQAPDMHQEICTSRGRAAALAQEEEDMREAAPAAAPTSGGRNGRGWSASTVAASLDPEAIAALPAPRFDPVPVYIGPKPGWTGPVAHAGNALPKPPFAAPETASAYAAAPDNTQPQGAENGTPDATSSAPLILQGAVHSPKPGALSATATARANKTSKIKTVAAAGHVPAPKKRAASGDKSASPPASQ